MSRVIDMFLAGLVRGIIVTTLIFLAGPICIAVLMSFDARSFLGPFPPTSFSTQWYARFFGEPLYISGIFNSLSIALISTAVSVALGLAAAIGLHKGEFPGRATLVSLFLAPLVIPAVVMGFGLLILFANLGFTSGYARLIIAHCVITIPYVIRSVTAALANIGTAVEEAAMSLGATPWTVIRTITAPIARAGIVVGAVLAFTVSFDDVSVGIFLADPESATLPLTLVSMMRSNFDLTIAAASTFMIVVAVLALALIEYLIGVDRVFGSGKVNN